MRMDRSKLHKGREYQVGVNATWTGTTWLLPDGSFLATRAVRYVHVISGWVAVTVGLSVLVGVVLGLMVGLALS